MNKMTTPQLHVVTGGLGYSGRFIVQRLLAAGHRVRTLTNSPHKPNPFGQQLEIHPFHFDDPPSLVKSLRGVRVLYNTYWVRFNYKTSAKTPINNFTQRLSIMPLSPSPGTPGEGWGEGLEPMSSTTERPNAFTHSAAVRNTLTLFSAAKSAGVQRIIHVSITNPSEDSPLEYFRGKAHLERALKSLGLSYAILRPAVLFGHDDILINNIAWILRHFPLFPIPGDGSYRLQPIYVEDLADLAVAQGRSTDNTTLNAIGPETFTYRALIETLGQILHRPRPILPVPPTLAYATARLAGLFLHDVIITREEIAGLMSNLLATDSPPTAPTRLTTWAKQHANTLGLHYANELSRRTPA